MLNDLHGLQHSVSVKRLIDKLGDSYQLCWYKPPWGEKYLVVVEYDMEGHSRTSVVSSNWEKGGQINVILYDEKVVPLTIQEMDNLPYDDGAGGFWPSLDRAIAVLRGQLTPSS